MHYDYDDDGRPLRPLTDAEIAAREAQSRRELENAYRHEVLLRTLNSEFKDDVEFAFARVVLGLDGYYVLAFAPGDGWHYGELAQTSADAVTAFIEGAARAHLSALPGVYS